jgi:hypothetical protein
VQVVRFVRSPHSLIVFNSHVIVDLQGGTFIFVGDKTIYAHYDPSTASHAPMEQVLSIASAQVVDISN